MKKIITLVILSSVLGINLLQAQSITIRGSVVDENGMALPGATIQTDDFNGTVADINGKYFLEIKSQNGSIQLTAKMLGYQSLDSLIIPQNKNTEINFELIPEVFDIPLIEITESQLNLFKFDKWRILDFTILEDKIWVLNYRNLKRYLSLFSLNGLILVEMELQEKYHKIHISCGEKIHLIGERYCNELHLHQGSLRSLSVYDVELFAKLIKPCVLEINNTKIFKEFSDHNKKARYFTYPQPNKPLLLQEIYDKKAAKVARGYYNDIISMYHRTVSSTTDENAIDYGMPRDNIIKRNEWSGDLVDLIISHALHFAVAYYQNVEAREIKIFECEKDSNLLITDMGLGELHMTNLERTDKISFDLPEGYNLKRAEMLKDKVTAQLYIVENKEAVYGLKILEDKTAFEHRFKLEDQKSTPEKLVIYNNVLYFFSRNNLAEINTRFYKKAF